MSTLSDATDAALAAERQDAAAQVAELEAENLQLAADLHASDATCKSLEDQITALKAQLDALAVVADDFTTLDAWSIYNGVSSYADQGPRVKTNVELLTDDGSDFARIWTRPLTADVKVGSKTLKAGEYAAGGIGHKIAAGHRETGVWSMDLRMSPSVGTRVAVMLWGDGNNWPTTGELDFMEAGGQRPDRQSMTVTNHWKGANGKNAQAQIEVLGDFTVWRHFVVTWSLGRFDVAVDGTTVATFTENVPANPMHLVVQTAIEGGAPAKTGTTPGYVDVRNLRIYA